MAVYAFAWKTIIFSRAFLLFSFFFLAILIYGSSPNIQRHSCKALIGLTLRAKMIGGDDPLCLKFWIKLTALERNRRFRSIFARIATGP